MASRVSASPIHSEFICDYPEQTADFYYGFFTGDSGCENNNARIVLVPKSDTAKIYKSPINIWRSVDSTDYWFRHSHHRKYIIVSDFSGLNVFDNVLNIIFHVDLPQIESDAPLDVWGYELHNNVLLYWSANITSKIEKEHNEKMNDTRYEIRDDKTKSRREQKIMIRQIKYMEIYTRSYNIPDELINKITLPIDPADLEN